MCGRGYNPRFLWTWPNSRISVMGGEQAANVLAQVKQDRMQKQNKTWAQPEKDAFMQNVRDSYEKEGNAYYASARLWDDGIIDPAQTRTVLGLSLISTMGAPIKETDFGTFRM